MNETLTHFSVAQPPSAVQERGGAGGAQPRPAGPRPWHRPVADAGALVAVIQPRPGWQAVDFRELWQYRELLYFFTWRDLKVRYKQTVAGAAWAIVRPIVTMVIFSLIFGKFLRVPSDGLPYPVFVFAGLLPWTFFSGAVLQCNQSLLGQAGLVTKVYFPRLLIPISSVGAGLADFGLNFVVYACIMLWFAHLPGGSVVLLPLLVLLTVMMALGIGCVFGSLTVSYRDFKYVVPFMLQAWMYLSPVIYPTSLLPESSRWVMTLNPMAGIIEAFRSTLLNQPLDWISLACAAVFAVGVFTLGLYTFRRAEGRFADVA